MHLPAESLRVLPDAPEPEADEPVEDEDGHSRGDTATQAG